MDELLLSAVSSNLHPVNLFNETIYNGDLCISVEPAA